MGGGRLKVYGLGRFLTGAPPTRGFFFGAREFRDAFWVSSRSAGATQQKKQSHFKGRFEHTAASSRRLLEYFPIYFQPSGGRSKVWTVSIRDRWARNTNFFGSIEELFFQAGALRRRFVSVPCSGVVACCVRRFLPCPEN